MGEEKRQSFRRISREQMQSIYRAGPEALFSLIDYLQDLIESLALRIEALEQQRHTDSHNSSKPPSSDGIGRKIVQTRKPTGKKPGGQSGHKGSTLPFSEHPDQVVVHAPPRCGKCGMSLETEALIGCERRQEVELPPVKAQVTDHQAQIKACSTCGAQTRGEFPVGLNSPIQYGSRCREEHGGCP